MPDENHSSRNDLGIAQRNSPDFNTNKPVKTGGRQCYVPPAFYYRFSRQREPLVYHPKYLLISYKSINFRKPAKKQASSCSP